MTNNLGDEKALDIKTIEILWTDTNFFTIFFSFSAKNHTGIAYKMVDSVAAIYNFLRSNDFKSSSGSGGT